ncbi:uncharacterized protein LOC143182564 [Calliopsis andreniformis]|uniref:uncharacterized protein LOC143182564 n=1 Tax=Calliopsis andreniformis TaxID=337506 RepID=UPI003FCE3DC4
MIGIRRYPNTLREKNDQLVHILLYQNTADINHNQKLIYRNVYKDHRSRCISFNRYATDTYYEKFAKERVIETKKIVKQILLTLIYYLITIFPSMRLNYHILDTIISRNIFALAVRTRSRLH